MAIDRDYRIRQFHERKLFEMATIGERLETSANIAQFSQSVYGLVVITD